MKFSVECVTLPLPPGVMRSCVTRCHRSVSLYYYAVAMPILTSHWLAHTAFHGPAAKPLGAGASSPARLEARLHACLQSISANVVESFEADRVSALIDLARSCGISLVTLMIDLGIPAPIHE
jgi:hypothetical protein